MSNATDQQPPENSVSIDADCSSHDEWLWKIAQEIEGLRDAASIYSVLERRLRDAEAAQMAVVRNFITDNISEKEPGKYSLTLNGDKTRALWNLMHSAQLA